MPVVCRYWHFLIGVLSGANSLIYTKPLLFMNNLFTEPHGQITTEKISCSLHSDSNHKINLG